MDTTDPDITVSKLGLNYKQMERFISGARSLFAPVPHPKPATIPRTPKPSVQPARLPLATLKPEI